MQIQNNAAVGYWVIASVFMAILAAMSYVLLGDGPPEGYSMLFMTVVFALFWLGGIGAAAYAFSKPRVLTLVEHAGVNIVLRYPFKTLRLTYGRHAITHMGVIESEDSEGDPYFIAQVTFADGRRIDLTEGSDRAACEQVLAQCQSALHEKSSDET